MGPSRGAEVTGYLRRATSHIENTSSDQNGMLGGSSSSQTSPSAAGGSTSRLRSRSLLTVDTSKASLQPESSNSTPAMPELRFTPAEPPLDDGQVLSSPVVDERTGGLPVSSSTTSNTAESSWSHHTPSSSTPTAHHASAGSDGHYRSSRPRSSSLHNYLPNPNDVAAKGKDYLLSRFKPMRQMSYVTVPLSSPGMPQQGSSSGAPATETLFEEHEGRQAPKLAGHSPTNATHLEPSTAAGQMPGVYSLLQPVGILCALFVLSTGAVIFLVSTIPTLSIPHNLSEVLDQASALKDYSQTSSSAALHVLSVLSVLFVYKQAFSIPGSLLTNCLFGSLYGVTASTILTSILTAIGSIACYFMAGKTSPLFHFLFPRALSTLQASINNSSDIFSHLLLIRLFPLLPYAMLNIAAGVLAVPAQPFFWTLVLGSAPFNAVTTQIGDLLATLPPGAATGDLSSIWTPSLLFKLLCISAVSALPVVFKKQIQSFLQSRKGDSPAIPMTASYEMPTRRTAVVEEASGSSTSSEEDPRLSEDYFGTSETYADGSYTGGKLNALMDFGRFTSR